MRRQQLLSNTADLVQQAETVGQYRVVAKQLPDGIAAGDLRTIANDLRGKMQAETAVIVLASNDGGKVPFAVAATPGAVEAGVKAGDLVKLIGGYIDGRGGGKPDLAQGSGANPDGIGAGLAAVRDELASK